AVRDEVCESGNMVALVGMINHSNQELTCRALKRLCIVLDTSSGCDYMWFTSETSGALSK
ncbi:unnamed protein product, partial [Ostreobium quekettii]